MKVVFEESRIASAGDGGQEMNGVGRDEMCCRKLLMSELQVEKAERDEVGLVVTVNCDDEMKQ